MLPNCCLSQLAYISREKRISRDLFLQNLISPDFQFHQKCFVKFNFTSFLQKISPIFTIFTYFTENPGEIVHGAPKTEISPDLTHAGAAVLQTLNNPKFFRCNLDFQILNYPKLSGGKLQFEIVNYTKIFTW